MGKRSKSMGSGGGRNKPVAAASSKQQQQQQQQQQAPKHNPFETRQQKEKFPMLGRTADAKKGKKPQNLARVREEARSARKESLLVEYRQKDKVNTFRDNRLGERDASLSREDKTLARFLKERQRADRDIFNLEDGPVNDDPDLQLTHAGRLLGTDDYEEDETFGGREEEEGGQLSREQTRAFFSQRGGDEGDGEGGGGHKTHREMMAEIMAKSKLHKRERQLERSQLEKLQDEVDQRFRAQRGLIHASASHDRPQSLASLVPGAGAEEEEEAQAYDAAVRELTLEKRVPATDRLRTAEEVAKESRDRMRELEAARLRRQRGEEDQGGQEDAAALPPAVADFERRKAGGPATGLLSADALEEELGELEAPGDRRLAKIMEARLANGDDDEHYDSDEEDSDSDGSDEEEEEDEFDAGSAVIDAPAHGVMPGEQAPLPASAARDSHSDSDEADDFGDDVPTDESLQFGPTLEDVPFTLPVPADGEQYQLLVLDRGVEQERAILERIWLSNNTKLSHRNADRMVRFFSVLLDRFVQLASEGEEEGLYEEKLTLLIVPLMRTARQVPLAATMAAREELQVAQQALLEGGGVTRPLLLLLHVFSVVFPTSDFHHPVTTPVALIIAELLSQQVYDTPQSLVHGLFLCTLALQFESGERGPQRFWPEAVTFLSSTLHVLHHGSPSPFTASSPVDAGSLAWVQPLLAPSAASSSSSKAKKRRRVEAAAPSTEDGAPQVTLSWLAASPVGGGQRQVASLPRGATERPEFWWQLTHMCLRLSHGFLGVWKSLDGLPEAVAPLVAAIGSLEMGAAPVWVSKIHGEVLHALVDASMRTLGARLPLQVLAAKPVALRQFNPKFEENYKLDRNYDPDRVRAETKKLTRQMKKEQRGAVRELTRDAAFLAEEQYKKQEAERERKKKSLGQIMNFLEGEQGNKNLASRLPKKKGSFGLPGSTK